MSSCMTGEWTREATLLLIDKYREKRSLWDPSDPGYFSHRNKAALWEELADDVGMTTEETRRRMQSLLASMRRERIRVRRSLKEKGEEYISPWFAYDRMAFLLERPFPPAGSYQRSQGQTEDSENVSALKKKRGKMRVGVIVQCNNFEALLKEYSQEVITDDMVDEIELNFTLLEQRAQSLMQMNEEVLKRMHIENDLSGMADERDNEEDHYLSRFAKLKEMKEKVLSQRNQVVVKEESFEDKYKMHGDVMSGDDDKANANDFPSRLCETTLTTFDGPSTSDNPLFGLNFFRIDEGFTLTNSKILKRKPGGESVLMNSSGKRKKNGVGLTVKPSSELLEKPSDDCTSFGQYISDKLKQYSSKTRCAVQHAICEIIFNADQGRLDTYCEVFPNPKTSSNKANNQTTSQTSVSCIPEDGCDTILGS